MTRTGNADRALEAMPGYLGSGWIRRRPIRLRVLVTTAVATPLMTHLLLPLVTRALRPWLLRSR